MFSAERVSHKYLDFQENVKASEYKFDIFVLAGGRGTRLKSYDSSKTKLMVDIDLPEGQGPMIAYTLSEISRAVNSLAYPSITLLTANHPDSEPDSIESFTREYLLNSDVQLKIVREPKLLGTAGAIYNALQSQKHQETVLVCPGDVLYPYSNILDLISTHKNDKGDITWATTTNPGENAQNTGKLLVDSISKRLIRSEESGSSLDTMNHDGNILRSTSVGVVVLESSSYLKNYNLFKAENPKETPDLYRDYIPWCLNLGIQVLTFDIAESAPDLGTPDRLNMFKSALKLSKKA